VTIGLFCYWWSFGTIKPLSLTVSEIFDSFCDAMVDMISKQRSRSLIFSTNRLMIHNFLQAVNSNVCSRMHRLSQYIRYRETALHYRQTDGRKVANRRIWPMGNRMVTRPMTSRDHNRSSRDPNTLNQIKLNQIVYFRQHGP